MGDIDMTVQERREKNLKRRRRQAAKRNMIILLATVMLITIGSIVFGSTFSSAKNDEEFEVYYKSVEIEQGDSLWNIAKEYKAEDQSIVEYIEELRELNNLTSDTIHEGQHLVVAYQVVVK